VVFNFQNFDELQFLMIFHPLNYKDGFMIFYMKNLDLLNFNQQAISILPKKEQKLSYKNFIKSSKKFKLQDIFT